MKNKFLEKFQFGTQKFISYGIWLMLIVLGFSVIQNANKVIATRRDIETEREKVTKMKEVNASLEKSIAEAQSAIFIEKQVRDRLGLAKAGESIVILPDVETVRKLAPKIASEESVLPDPNWKKWEKLFF